MIDSVLSGKSLRARLTLKALLSLAILALSVALPQLVHLCFGAGMGVTLLPMYLPVLLGAGLLGVRWGVTVGVLSPVVSFALTSLFSSPMPALSRLPFLVAELAVFALVGGLFAKKIEKNMLWAFPAVLAAQICGRGSFLLLSVLFGRFASLPATLVLSQVKAGIPGLLLQLALVPLFFFLFGQLLSKEKNRD